MSTYYDAPRQRLVFVKQAATAAYWDIRWQSRERRAQIERDSRNRVLLNITRQWLTPDPATRILEGGCGMGGLVLGLARAGYDAVGIDYAAETIAASQRLFPQLALQVGDVTALPFPDNHFDGYWSLGVIEHNYYGYNEIFREAVRTLKVGGYLFLTFPYLNLLRKAKAHLGLYPEWPETPELLQKFYQFGLSAPAVTRDLAQLGMVLRHQQPLDGLKGMKDEIAWLRPTLQRLYQNHHPTITLLKNGLSLLSTPWAGHVFLGVFQKQK